jgi:hypothetical protein
MPWWLQLIIALIIVLFLCEIVSVLKAIRREVGYLSSQAHKQTPEYQEALRHIRQESGETKR